MEWTSECNEASLSVLFHVPHLSRSIRRRISTNGGMEYEVYDNSHSVNGRSSSSDDWMYVCFECCWGLVRNLLWTLKGPNEYKHKAAGDVLTFYIHTHVWRKWKNLRSLGVLYSKWVQADSFTRGDCARLWYLLFGGEADSIGSPISWSNSIEFDNSKSCSSIDRTSDRREETRAKEGGRARGHCFCYRTAAYTVWRSMESNDSGRAIVLFQCRMFFGKVVECSRRSTVTRRIIVPRSFGVNWTTGISKQLIIRLQGIPCLFHSSSLVCRRSDEDVWVFLISNVSMMQHLYVSPFSFEEV